MNPPPKTNTPKANPSPHSSTKAEFDETLLEVLVCPVSGGSLVYDPATQRLISPKAGLAYPIRDGIAIMLAEEAEKLSPKT